MARYDVLKDWASDLFTENSFLSASSFELLVISENIIYVKTFRVLEIADQGMKTAGKPCLLCQ